MIKHFVTFFSPGTFVAEQDKMEIKEWDIAVAVAMSKKINQRHGARPYGFHFNTQEQTNTEWGTKTTKTSGMYYLGGKIRTLAEIEAENNPDNRILISNMKGNKWDSIVENCNSYRWAQPLEKGDVVLDMSQYE